MTFEVKYRNKQGAVEYTRVDAASRSEVFTILKERGITSVIQVLDATGKKPHKVASSGAPISGKIKGLMALVAVCVIGAVVFMFVSKDEPKPTVGEKKPAKEKRIEVVTPEVVEKVVAETQKVEAVKVEAPKGFVPAQPHPKLKTYRDERGILRYEGGARVPGQRQTGKPIVIGSHKPQIFKHAAEEHISYLMNFQLGQEVVGDMKYGDAFVKSFKESLDEPIEILETDDENTRELKQAVIETKADLKARMEAGEDIAKAMNDAMDECRRLGNYRHDLQVLLSEIRNDTNQYSDKDIDDFIKAANAMLKEKGLKPIANPKLVIRSMTNRVMR